MDFTRLKLIYHKLRNWEYWSVYVVYFPTFLFWLYQSLRLRSVSFYQHANPAIDNGGLFEVSKMKIYELLPTHHYPKTVLVQPNCADFEALMTANQLSFPIIAKPDKGFRGVMVQRLSDLTALKTYAQAVQQPFLLQAISDYPNELGLFYTRLPDSENGKITGITVKVFLTITGDGVHDLAHFIHQNPRFELQFEQLNAQFDLQKVLKNGEKLCLVPYGNHNRGTEFLDGTDLISDKLETAFNQILSKIDGFYYGRLDIRYQNIADLEDGKNFDIIELNGAMSEPTHIYDPKKSFWQGQKEIFRHQKIFFQIIDRSLAIR